MHPPRPKVVLVIATFVPVFVTLVTAFLLAEVMFEPPAHGTRGCSERYEVSRQNEVDRRTS